jgi:hypothetical protein
MTIVNAKLAKLDIKKLSKSQIHSELESSAKRFRQMIKGVAQRRWNLVILGEPGTGKTQLIVDTFRNDPKVAYIKGVPSAAGLFKFLYDNKDCIAVLDDCDNIYESTDGTEILKAACESHRNKRISWEKQNMVFEKMGMTRSFIYTGNIILISNKNLRRSNDRVTRAQKLMAPVLDRCQVLLAGMPDPRWDLANIRRMEDLEQIHYFKEQRITPKIQLEIIDFLEQHLDSFRNVSFRTLKKACDIRLAQPRDWQELALESLT